MKAKSNMQIALLLQSFARAVSVIVISISLVVFAGWAFDIPFFRSIVPGASPMKINTAFGFLCAGISILLLHQPETKPGQKRIGQAFAFLVILIGLLTLMEYVVQRELGFDRFYSSLLPASTSPFHNKISPVTALCLTLSGVAILRMGSKLSQYLALSIVLLSVPAIVGYLYNYEALYQLAGYDSISLPSALTFLSLSFGILASRPGLGIMKLITSNRTAGKTVRFLLPGTIIAILFLGLLVEKGEELGLIDTGYGSVVLVMLLILVASPLIYFYAKRINSSEVEIIRLSRLYATLSQVNQTIIRVQNQQELFEAICKVAVEFGEFAIAWIGVLDEESGEIRPVAATGLDLMKWPLPPINIYHSEYQHGLLATAIRASRVVTNEDIQANSTTLKHHKEIAKRGYHSLAAVPIQRKGKPIGVLNLGSREAGLFRAKKEISLLEEMGLDISFALDMMAKEVERKQAEEALRENEERIRLSLQAADQGLYDLNVQTGETVVNREYAQMLGYDPETFVETNAAWIERLHPDDRESVAKAYSDYVNGLIPEYRIEFRQKMKNGHWKWLLSLGKVIEYDAGGKPLRMLGTHTDITERKRAEEEIQSRSRQLAALLDASQSLTGSLNLAEILQRITDQATDILGIETSAIYLTSGDHIYLGATTPALPPEFPETRASLADHPHIAKALETGQAVIVPDATFAELTDAEQTVARALGLRTILYIPLIAKQQNEGVLILGSLENPREFSDNERALASTLSNQAALAIANAKLYEDLARYVKELENQINERRHAQESLRKSEERFRLLFENNHTVMMLIEPVTGAIRSANEAAARFYGYSVSELCAMSINQINQLPPEEVYAERMRALQEERNYFHFQHRLSNGEIRLVEVHTAPVNVEEGILLFSIVYDITDRRQSEEKLKRHVSYLTGLREVDQAIASSFDVRLSLNILTTRAVSLLKADAASILLLDPVMNMLEYGASHGFETNLSQKANIRLSESYAGKAVMERRMIKIPNLKLERNHLFDTEFLKEEKFVSYCGLPLLVKGKVVGVMEIFHRSAADHDQEWFDFLDSLAGQAAIAIDNSRLWDQVQRHARDLEMRVADRTAALNRTNVELEHANRAKDEFLANMSHELRTPLNSILGLAESLLEQRRDPLTDYQQRSLQIIESSGHHLLELINDILDLSKIEAGKFDYYPQTVELNALCRSSLAFVKSQAAKKSITISYVNETSIANIMADPRRLKQILVNLLTNAVKFTPEEGEVTLHVHADLEEDLVEFSVIDTGIGIAPQDLKRLFQPFVQVDSKLNRQFEGTGLGLALVQKLTDMHGGSVHVESTVGVGSRFTVQLPCGQKMSSLQNNREVAGESWLNRAERLDVPVEVYAKSKLVLLAEDNMANILTIGEYLKSHGYRFVEAHDGLEAIERAKANDPDIILMDIQMPVLDGLEAIRRLRTMSRFATTPIIALTALAMPGDRERCMEAGANEFMPKPVRLRVLKQTIGNLLPD